MKYLIVIEKTATGFSAYSPDLEGCAATGSDRNEVHQAMESAITMHLDALREDGHPVPEPKSSSSYVEVPA